MNFHTKIKTNKSRKPNKNEPFSMSIGIQPEKH